MSGPAKFQTAAPATPAATVDPYCDVEGTPTAPVAGQLHPAGKINIGASGATDMLVAGQQATETHSLPAAISGTDITGSSLPAGGVGSRGWFSAIADVLGIKSGAAVVTDANGTAQQYLRGLVKLFTSVTFKAASTAAVDGDPAIVTRSSVLGDRADGAAGVTAGTSSIRSLLQQLVITDEATRAAVADTTTPAPTTNAGFLSVAVEFTRPANTTAYVVGQSVQSSTSAPAILTYSGAGRVASGTGWIAKCRAVTDQVTCTGIIRIHLWSVSNPTLTNDGTALADTYADVKDATKYLGYIDLPQFTPGGAGAVTQNDWTRLKYKSAAGQQVYAFCEARNAWTPANGQKITVTLDFEQD